MDEAPGDDGVIHPNWYRYASLADVEPPAKEFLAIVLATLGVYGGDEGTIISVAYKCSAGSRGLPSCR